MGRVKINEKYCGLKLCHYSLEFSRRDIFIVYLRNNMHLRSKHPGREVAIVEGEVWEAGF